MLNVVIEYEVYLTFKIVDRTNENKKYRKQLRTHLNRHNLLKSANMNIRQY